MSAALLAACGVGPAEVRNGPQAVLPSPSVLAQGTTPAATRAAATGAAPAAPVAALNTYCAANLGNPARAEADFTVDGFRETDEILSGGDGRFTNIYTRPNTPYAMGIQRVQGTDAAYGCAVIAPDSTALRDAFAAQARSRPGTRDALATLTASARNPNLQQAWRVPAAGGPVLYVAAISNSTRYGAGRTLALAVTPNAQ